MPYVNNLQRHFYVKEVKYVAILFYISRKIINFSRQTTQFYSKSSRTTAIDLGLQSWVLVMSHIFKIVFCNLFHSYVEYLKHTL